MISIVLVGDDKNSAAIGARVQVETKDGRVQTAEVSAGCGYLSQSTARLFFGVGDSSVKTITVTWPDGSKSTSDAVPENGVYKIVK